ncbi:putative alpha/beta superfamily hydrolase [Pseudomonas oryzihabitans]
MRLISIFYSIVIRWQSVITGLFARQSSCGFRQKVSVQATYVIVTCLLATGNAYASPVSLDSTEQWVMKSAEGRDYRIMVSLPEGDIPYTGGYPVIYLLDGNAYFPAFHAAKRAMDDLRSSIIVAIGYPNSAPLDLERRAYDLSPPQPPERNKPAQGGQDLFIRFIENRLMPEVNRRFKTDADQTSLVGHSFGGMFAVYTLFTRPDLFKHVVAISPTLWWNDRYLMAPERQFVIGAHTGKINLVNSSLKLLIGGKEMPQEIQDARSLQIRLEELSQYGFRSDFQIEPRESHMSIMFHSAADVLEELMSTRRY